MKNYTGMLLFSIYLAHLGNIYAAESTAPDKIVVDESKKLDAEGLKDKREGVFVTGLPRLGSDPVNGQGIGADLFLYSNGNKKDPLFEYTPYRFKTELHAFFTNKDEKQATVGLDIPYIFNTRWRIRFEGGYEDNPNLLYFGNGTHTLKKLSHRGTSYNTYSGYEEALGHTRSGDSGEASVVTDEMYNTYRKQETILNLSAERSYQKGTVRILAGFEMASINITTFDGKLLSGSPAAQGKSLLQQENAAGKIRGLGRNLINIFQVGLIYDTRNFEPDPSNGWFTELTDEYSAKNLGSAFNFNKVYFHSNFYKQILPSVFNHLVFAGRYALSLTEGDAPFYEYQDSWGSQGSIEGLGGGGTLRGYKQSRFLAPLVSFINLEMRWRLGKSSLWGQHFTYTLVPFVDAGRVWNRISDFNLKDYKFNSGIGLRIPWNQSTIFSFDYAHSTEDNQFFFTFGNIF